MAHFAKLDGGNIVETVEVVHNDIATTEQAGVDFLNNLYGTSDVWKQTSYNTKEGEHLLGGTPLRKNYAGMGYKYDESKDAFYEPQPYPSWTLNETSCIWEPPVAKPEETQEQFDNDDRYKWNETNQTWDLVNISELE
tara:strand:+ start:11 stop:424 length:414 start_codon:yes stop_codon:yes gene_type:complete